MDSGSGFCLEECRSNGGADFYVVVWISAAIHFVTMSFCSHGREPVAMVSLFTFATDFAPKDGVTDDPPNLF